MRILDLPESATRPRRRPGLSMARRALPPWLVRLLLPLLLPLLVLGGAELAVRAGLVPANLMPPPSSVAATLFELARHGLAGHVAASTLRVALGFQLGAGAGLLIGALVALNATSARLLDPSLQALRAI